MRRLIGTESDPGFFLRGGFLGGGLGRAVFEHASLGAVVPTDEVLVELLGREARRLDRPLRFDLRAGPAHQLLGAPRHEQGQPELAVHALGHLLNHVVNLSSETLCESAPGARPGGWASAFWPEQRILTQEWPDRGHHLRQRIETPRLAGLPGPR